MMTGSLILIILGVMALIGIGYAVLSDFRMPPIGAVALIAITVGLNLIPQIRLANFIFSVGTLLFFFVAVLYWLVGGKAKNKLLVTLLTLTMTGILYGATRLSLFYGNMFWGNINVFYAIIIGVLTVLLTKNAKYSFVASALSIMTATLLSQIGGIININSAFSNAIIATTTGFVIYTLAIRIIPKKPSRLSYYFEAGRMYDDD